MTEDELVRTAARLGTAQAETLDPARVAERVLARLASEPAEVRPLPRRVAPWFVGLAAAAALLVVLRLTVLSTSPTSPTSPSARSVLHELDDLGTGELEEILETIPVPTAALSPAPEAAPLSELDSIHLERLLRSLEG